MNLFGDKFVREIIRDLQNIKAFSSSPTGRLVFATFAQMFLQSMRKRPGKEW